MRNSFIILSLVILAACSAKVLAPTQSDADRGSARFAGLSLDQLTAGKKAYESYCAKCHGLKVIGDYTVEQWESIVPNMVKKANKNEHVISDSDHEAILRYVVTMRSR